MFLSDNNNNVDETSFPEVPEEAIVKPEEERPIRISKKQEEEEPDDGNSNDNAYTTNDEDLDGDDNPDWSSSN